jgi:hypothetical protein
MDTLLAVPQYSDLLDDQDDESQQGQLLVLRRQGWHTEMAKWITEAQGVEIVSNKEYHGQCAYILYCKP